MSGRWCSLYRAIDREGNLVDARLSQTRDVEVAQRFFREALAVAGDAPARVAPDGHHTFPRAIREALGTEVARRTSRYRNKRIERDHRGTKQRS